MRILARASALGVGALLALLPAIASAEEGARALERGEDWNKVMILTFAALLGVMLVATLGYLYRMKRNIFWDFQQPAAPHDDHH